MENMRKLERGEKDRSFPAKARCEAIKKITDESFLRTVLTNYSDKRTLETTREKMKSIGLDPIYHKVPEIHEVNKLFESLKNEGFIDVWHLPFENVMTRLAACIFFFTPTDESKLEAVWKKFGEILNFYYRRNEEKKMSSLDWRVEFNEGVDKL